MTKQELRAVWALPADIAARQRRIDKLRTMLDELPREVADTVDSTAGVGNSTIICRATIHGRPPRTPMDKELRALLVQQKAAQQQYSAVLPSVVRFIEAVPDAELRVILSTKWVDGGSWADCAKALGHKAAAEACKKRAERFLKGGKI